MCYLRIPHEFVGIHRVVVISSTAVLVQVSRYACTPRTCNVHRSAVCKLPCVEIRRSLKVVPRIHILQGAVKFHFKPIVAECQSESFGYIKRLCYVLFRVRITLQTQIPHPIVIIEIRHRVHIPETCRINRSVVNEHSRSIPIAIDVLRPCYASTRFLIVCHLIPYAVARRTEIDACHYRLLTLLQIVVVFRPQIVGKRRFQSRITFRDVQRVTVVGYVKQVGHARLRRARPIVQPQIAHIAELIAEIHRRCDVQHRACRVRMYALIILYEV